MLSKGFKICDKKDLIYTLKMLNAKKNEAIIKVEKACISKADLRYYLGTEINEFLI
jgi:threonine dehydrogenase-like Zn-dependent dehydrogenase